MAPQTSLFPSAAHVGRPLSVTLLIPCCHFFKNHIFGLFFSSSWHSPQYRLSQLWSLNKPCCGCLSRLLFPFTSWGPLRAPCGTLWARPLLPSSLPPTPPAPGTMCIVATDLFIRAQLGLPSTHPHVTAPDLTHHPPLPVKPRDAHLCLYMETFGTSVWIRSTGQIVERDDFLNASKRGQP